MDTTTDRYARFPSTSARRRRGSRHQGGDTPFSSHRYFDIGANIGQSAEHFVTWEPQVDIHCFEPVSDTFQQLTRNTARYSQVQCHNMAMGATAGSIALEAAERSVMFRLQNSTPDESALASAEEMASPKSATADSLEMTIVGTVTDFCVAHRINRISFLKIDTEGHDLEVLKGAETMLSERRIDFIQVEAGMNVRNDWHVPASALILFLEERNYTLFGIYEQSPEWLTGKPHLRRADLVFLPMPE